MPVDLRSTPHAPSDDVRDQKAWQLLHTATRFGVWEVATSANTPSSRRFPSASNMSLFMTLVSQSARTSAGLMARVTDCSADAFGHQCTVSGVTEAARPLVARVQDLCMHSAECGGSRPLETMTVQLPGSIWRLRRLPNLLHLLAQLSLWSSSLYAATCL